MTLPLSIAVLITLGLALLTFVLSFAATRVSRVLLLAFFVIFVALLGGILGVNSYLFSNVLVVGFAISGGALFAKIIVGRRKCGVIFLVLLAIVSALDIISFASGAQASSPSSSSAILHANFTAYLEGSRFILGSVDLLILSLATSFFILRGFHIGGVIAFSVIALELPFLYVIVPKPSIGLPIAPFIALCAAAMILSRQIQRKRKQTAYNPSAKSL